MAKFVIEVQDIPTVAEPLKEYSVQYPPLPATEIPNVIASKLGIYNVKTDINSYFNWEYWKSLFYQIPDHTYQVILCQKKQVGDEITNLVFLLHKSTSLEESKIAFEKWKNTIEPLVDDCTLMLTEDLLNELLVDDEPVDPSNLAVHLLEVKETNPDAHSDWVQVFQALVLDALVKKDSDDLEKLIKEEDSRLMRLCGAFGNGKIFKLLSSKLSDEGRKKILARKDDEGKTPLHVAFEKDRPKAVSELLRSGASIALSADNENGSNPFHLAARNNSAASIAAAHHGQASFQSKPSPELPERQIFADALNATNNKGFTALMIAVQHNAVDSVITLLQAGADPDYQHFDSGDTALHLAAAVGNISTTKAIIAFRADLLIENKAGKTPLDVARETSKCEECIQALEKTTELFNKARENLAHAEIPKPLAEDSTVLLSLDGGGSRGLLSCQTLIAVYKRMKQLQPDCAPLHKYFDYIAGTSIGGILALAMVYANTSLEGTVAGVFKVAEEVLSKTPNVPQHVVDKNAKETIGESIELKAVDYPRVIITTAVATQNPPQLTLLCNYRETHGRCWKVWEAGRATSAAPMYFPPFEDKYIDGGTMANNPTLDAMVEIVEQTEREFPDKRPSFGMVLSIGTGIPPPDHVDQIDVHAPRVKNFIFRMKQTIAGIKGMINMFVAQSTHSNGQEVSRAKALCKAMDVPYYRFSPRLPEVINLAECNREKLADMMYLGLQFTLKNAKEIDEVARRLLTRNKQ